MGGRQRTSIFFDVGKEESQSSKVRSEAEREKGKTKKGGKS